MKTTVERAARIYHEAYARFVAEQRVAWPKGVGELKLALEGANRFERLYCIDFASNDGEWKLIEMSADSVAPSERAEGTACGVDVVVEGLVWNDVQLEWAAPEVPEDAFAHWFERWFDPEDVRQDASGNYGGVIHSLSVERCSLACDLGTAPPAALWELLTTLRAAGVLAVRLHPGAR